MVSETSTAVCDVCGFEAKNFTGLSAHKRGAHPQAVPEVVIRSERGRARRAREVEVLTPLEQIPGRPTELNGPWAYFINPDGATIRDAVILHPNGAKLPRNEDTKGRYSENAEYYQGRMSRKGFTYVGPTLNEAGVHLLVETLKKNQADEALYLQELIDECDLDIQNSDRPDWRDNQRKRKAQLQKRLAHVQQEINAEDLIAELNSIARAQRMARVSPETMMVMREMIGEQDAKFQAALSKFQSGDLKNEEVSGVSSIG